MDTIKILELQKPLFYIIKSNLILYSSNLFEHNVSHDIDLMIIVLKKFRKRMIINYRAEMLFQISAS